MTSPCDIPNKHPLPNTVHFFKIILRTSLADGKLMLPKPFTSKYGDGVSNPVFLKPPDGTEWKINWRKIDGGIWFQKGWKEFATYYSLDHGHFLLFEYKGTSHFDVQIFDTSALEIDYPIHATHDEEDSLDQMSNGSDGSGEILEQSPSRKTKLKSPMSSPQPCKKMKSDTRSSNGQNLHQQIQTRLTRLQEARLTKQELKEEENEGICRTEWLKEECLTSIKISEASKRSSSFNPKQPSFTRVMKSSYIEGHYMKIPSKFAEEYLKKTQAVVLLEVKEGRTWPVIYSAPRIHVGWEKFEAENNLKVGDVCVFELIQKMQGLCFKVTIFQGAEEPICNTSKGGNGRRRRSSGLESLRFWTNEALEKAKKFTSENPFYIVRIRFTKNYIGAPRIHAAFYRKYFAPITQNVMIQFESKLWPVKLLFDASRNTAQFSAGWFKFARENTLQAGDVCVFELRTLEDDAVLHAHIFRCQS
ncbi:hypothetical protein RJT34_07528 [Clitoria ternatea]|uniref:TF-B3 domain-containing protein n=1 Tax=Clitoria ternatea TaxID=43366 RepID=A0AAN9PU93_CLITE